MEELAGIQFKRARGGKNMINEGENAEKQAQPARDCAAAQWLCD